MEVKSTRVARHDYGVNRAGVDQGMHMNNRGGGRQTQIDFYYGSVMVIEPPLDHRGYGAAIPSFSMNLIAVATRGISRSFRTSKRASRLL